MIYISMLLSYLMGSIPFGFIIAKTVKKIDIRQHGSGNIGATNVARVAGKAAGVSTLILDILKGLIAVTCVPLLAKSANPAMVKILCALAVIAGHNWTVFMEFQGGKGVATTAGALIGIAPLAVLSALGVWIAVFVLSKYVSLSSITAGVFLPVFMFTYNEPVPFIVLGIVTALVGIVRHKENIKRLLKGNEKRFKFGGKKDNDKDSSIR